MGAGTFPCGADAARAQVAGAQLLGKVTVLEEEFAAASIDAIGIQEGRSRRSEIHPGLHYERYIGAADDHGGSGASSGCDALPGSSCRPTSWSRRASRGQWPINGSSGDVSSWLGMRRTDTARRPRERIFGMPF